MCISQVLEEFRQEVACHCARQEGRVAGLQGVLRGENPHADPLQRFQWDSGWAETNHIRRRIPITGVVA